MKPEFNPNAPYQPDHFAFKDLAKVDEILSRYPKGRAKSAVMPLLDLAQRQHQGWIPAKAMEVIAGLINEPLIKVHEVATFYSMYKLAPVGKFLVQVCGTTPCWLCGSADIIRTCEQSLGIKMGETTEDGLFTLEEVECLGACVNAPMIQVNDDYYEDLSPDIMEGLLSALKEGKEVPVGSQKGRKASMAQTGPTSLQVQAKKAGVI